MLVKWKILCGFGLVFWSTMCFIDYVFGNIINKGEFTKLQEGSFDDEEDKGYSCWSHVAMWGMLSFAASFVGCVLLKFLKQQIYKFTQGSQVDHQLINTVSTVRIPTVSNGLDIKFEPVISENDRSNATPNLNLLEAVKDFPVTTESSETATKLVEKRCAKLKEEMREMQMSTWKEYSSLNKKLDGLSKEKADLGRQLQQSQRENKQLKQQLDDVVGDRALLIKRLECATKEIKLNTSSKQMTLDKLEEAVACSNQMRLKIGQLTKERDDWVAKYKRLEDNYKTLKESVQMSLDNRIINQHKSGGEEKAETELEQSEKDIAKVQNKLMDLEKSLEKMRSKPSNVSANDATNVKNKTSEDVENSKDNQELEDDDEKCDQSEKDIDSSQRIGDSLEFEENTMDLIRESTSESGDQCTVLSTENPSDTKTDLTNTHQEMESVTRTASTPNSISSSSTSSRTDGLVLSIEESETEVMFPLGIVSQSPAFQKFLLKVLESPVV